jgi:hypothetical protein
VYATPTTLGPSAKIHHNKAQNQSDDPTNLMITIQFRIMSFERWATGGEEQLLRGGVKVDVDVVRVGVREQVSCGVAMAIAVEQRPAYFRPHQVLIRLPIVRRHARFEQRIPCGALPKPK